MADAVVQAGLSPKKPFGRYYHPVSYAIVYESSETRGLGAPQVRGGSLAVVRANTTIALFDGATLMVARNSAGESLDDVATRTSKITVSAIASWWQRCGALFIHVFGVRGTDTCDLLEHEDVCGDSIPPPAHARKLDLAHC